MDDELQPQPGSDRRPPDTPVLTATAVEDQPPAPRRGWGMFAAMPVVVFMLFLAAINMYGSGSPHTMAELLMGLILQSIIYFVIIFYIHSVVTGRHRFRFWLAMKWVRTANTRSPLVYLLMGGVLALAVQLASPPTDSKMPIERMFFSREAAMVLAAFAILVAPLVEELIFRGFIFGALEFTWGLRIALWVSAVLFAAIHVPQLRTLPHTLLILVVGLALSSLRAQTGSLIPPYLLHLGYNGSLFAMFYLSTHGFRRIGG